MNLEEQIKKSKDNMFSSLDNIDIDGLKAEGVTIRVGDRLLKFSINADEQIPDIDVIKSNFREKLNEQQKRIKEKINDEIEKINSYHNSLKLEFERKEKILEDKLKSSEPMPNITYKDTLKGLSLTKGKDPGTLCWLVNGVYWPKTIDFKPLDIKFTKRMVSPVIYMIITKGKFVTEVSTRKLIGLDYFNHYHQNNPDCWGKWTYKSEWETPNDIIEIGRQAESVLENINTGSTATSNPRGLPRISTIKKNIVDTKENSNIESVTRNSLRQGITTDIRSDDSEVWSL